jgi:ABC-type lipoprotein export system ATPase subunit
MSVNDQGLYIECLGLFKIYKIADIEVVALRGLDFNVELGEMVAVVGASGSGKSTLLNILAGFEKPSAGQLNISGLDALGLRGREASLYRRNQVGFIWQKASQNLVPYFTAHQNIEMPLLLLGTPKSDRVGRVEELLALTGLEGRADHTPDQLSGGEQQRLSVAVALAHHPTLLLADEPTGELDTETGEIVWNTLQKANQSLGTTIVIVTHDDAVFKFVDRVVYMQDGRISSERLHRGSFERVTEQIDNWEELSVVDRTGHLQVPREFLDHLHIASRARVTLEEDHISIYQEGNRDD